MNNNSGKFKCPKCGYNKLCSFENFFSREEFLNNEIKTKWIFYKEEKKNGNAVYVVAILFVINNVLNL